MPSPVKAAMEDAREQITQLLLEVADGRKSLDDLIPVIYRELQLLAHRHLLNERSGHTLNTTALANEAYLKLVQQDRVAWKNRAHFFATASMAMRRLLVSHARARLAEKRGGGQIVTVLPEDRLAVGTGDTVEILALNQALERLSELSPRAVQVVECRFFGGLSIEETGAALEIAPMTVKRDWQLAKAWLRRELHSPESNA